MTNYEKFKNRIITLFSRGITLAVIDGDPCCCRDPSGIISGVICGCCDFCGMESCEEARVKWLHAEYIERPKLTKQEMAFLTALDPAFQYVVRDKQGCLIFFRLKPQKNQSTGTWEVSVSQQEDSVWYDYSRDIMSFSKDQTLFSINFDFIKWDDKEPYDIKDLLKAEVIDNV